jgi:ABC-type nitrate/sulfonate/bicarbonate transport system ATPase subunit
MLQIDKLVFSWINSSERLFGPLDFTFKNGSITAIIGQNGVGKSTLLNVISNRLKADSGKVTLLENIQKNHIKDGGEYNYMMQESNRQLFPHLTLKENIYISRYFDNKNDVVLERAIDILFSDKKVLQRYPKQCSGGQRQRALLCRAINDMSNFTVTLLDEPFSQISQDVKAGLYQLIDDLIRKLNGIIIFVTHDIAEAIIFADKIIVLKQHKPVFFDCSFVNYNGYLFDDSNLRQNIINEMLDASVILSK